MLNTLSKFLEIMIKNRLQTELDDRDEFHPHQYAFRQSRSTIQTLKTDMQIAENFRKSWCALFSIDVKNAFNTATHSIIIKKLRDKRISVPG